VWHSRFGLVLILHAQSPAAIPNLRRDHRGDLLVIRAFNRYALLATAAMKASVKRSGLLCSLLTVLLTFSAAQQTPPDQPDLTLDSAARRQVIEAMLQHVHDYYVFPSKAGEIEKALRERLARGEYDQINSARQFAATLTQQLQALAHDKHLRVAYSYKPLPQHLGRGGPGPAEMGRLNYGFERVERLPGNIGYVDFRNFVPAELGKETVAAVFSFLANTDAIIFDLRKNGGGDPAMVAQMVSYLVGPEPVHLNDIYWRYGDSERKEEFWTQKEVAGKRYGRTKDVYVLTSSRTFSGGEEFTYDLKTLKRAIIVGETTGGGANPGGPFRLNDHFAVMVPRGHAVNPVTKTNWEGVGVEPDVKAPADDALKTAQVMALKKLAAKATDAELRSALERELASLQKESASAGH
jgi:hypothetical protein